MKEDNHYHIPANMGGVEKFWTNGNLYITWLDAITGMFGLLLLLLIVNLPVAILSRIVLLLATVLITLILMLIKPNGEQIYLFMLRLWLYWVRPKCWTWRCQHGYTVDQVNQEAG